MTRTISELWSQSCDFSTHLCTVDRLEDRSLSLTITLAGAGIIHQQPVELAHDVADWRELAGSIIDHPERWNRAR